mmetsp:Transcript_22671/g.53974  ORF Transcript_22671/g.53974 Transcript_22671/m.53974 type:complete len:290 (-) Transcript_22671:84-953(-)
MCAHIRGKLLLEVASLALLLLVGLCQLLCLCLELSKVGAPRLELLGEALRAGGLARPAAGELLQVLGLLLRLLLRHLHPLQSRVSVGFQLLAHLPQALALCTALRLHGLELGQGLPLLLGRPLQLLQLSRRARSLLRLLGQGLFGLRPETPLLLASFGLRLQPGEAVLQLLLLVLQLLLELLLLRLQRLQLLSQLLALLEARRCQLCAGFLSAALELLQQSLPRLQRLLRLSQGFARLRELRLPSLGRLRLELQSLRLAGLQLLFEAPELLLQLRLGFVGAVQLILQVP